MNATKVKTRHGLILQSLLGTALTQAGFSYRENWQYDPDLERPDYTIPDSDKPNYAIEVHQTDARDSFRMKILRAFNAVAEAKVFFGVNLVSVNILFGDPDNELPESNVKALCGIFDVNLIPRNDSKEGDLAKKLEQNALELASDESHDVTSASRKLRSICKKEITALSSIVKRSLSGVTANKQLAKIWALEKKRISTLTTAPTSLPSTYYKRSILESLYLSDNDFVELIKIQDPNKVSKALQKQLVDTGLAITKKAIGGDKLELIQRFQKFICDPSAQKLRKLCENRISKSEAMHWFIEDIRNAQRRNLMAGMVFKIITGNPQKLSKWISDNIEDDSFQGIEHRRCWVADLSALTLGVSHNEMNRQLVSNACDPESLGNPFNQISYKSERFMAVDSSHKKYATGISKIVEDLLSKSGANVAANRDIVADRLLQLRLDGIIKLQKLNPLYIVIEAIATNLVIDITSQSQPSIINDLAQTNNPVGRSNVFVLKKGDKECLLNALYIGEGYGSEHKADEWSARIRSLGYRLENGVPFVEKRLANIMVVDGEWSKKSLKKLQTAGWTHICQLPQVETTLKGIFGIPR